MWRCGNRAVSVTGRLPGRRGSSSASRCCALGLITLCCLLGAAAQQTRAELEETSVFVAKSSYKFQREHRNVVVEIVRHGKDLTMQSVLWCSTEALDPISAIPNKDFVKRSSKVIFDPGKTSAACMVTLLNNDAPSPESTAANKSFLVTLSSAANATITLPFQSTITIVNDNNDGPVVQFLSGETTVSEGRGVVEVAVVRDGESDTFVSVLCTTQAQSALSGPDYVERLPMDESVILFAPGERLKRCAVTLRDDPEYEATETFQLRLSDAESSGRKTAIIGANATAVVRITDDDDLASVHFEQPNYTIREPSATHQVTSLVISIVRSSATGITGSENRDLRVRVNTRDGLAVAGLDYHPKSALLTFGPSDSRLPFEVEILHNPDHAFRHRAFEVVLSGDDDLTGTDHRHHQRALTTSVTVLDSSDGGSVLPVAPVVVSLTRYDTLGVPATAPSSGYPLVCVTPCDVGFQDAAARRLCLEAGLDQADVMYAWEVSDAGSGERARFAVLTVSTLFARVDTRVLDSMFYRAGYQVRCSARLMVAGRSNGVALKSDPVTISGDNAVCRSPSSASGSSPLGFQSQPFVASLGYVGSHDHTHPNRLRIRVEIPHHDGLIPLVSTFPLDNVPLLLSDPFYRKHHACSNLLFPAEREAFLGGGFLKDWNGSSQSDVDDYPHQFDSDMRGNRTVLIYRHLNLKRCLWTFEVTYHVTELVDLCGGHVTADAQVSSAAKSSITVRVPLHVSAVVPSAIDRWASLEHHTDMDFSFAYDTVAWHSGLDLANPVRADLRVLRILLGTNGQLVIEFETKAKFKGLFVVKHGSTPQYESRIVPPNLLELTFNLTLIRSTPTYDGPTQVWRAISNYSLKDYSGQYVVQLVPCTMAPEQSYATGTGNDALVPCTPQSPILFNLPISFHQVNRPVPVAYTLNTNFLVTNNRQEFLINSAEDLSKNHIDHCCTFSKDQKVYGKVLWHPSQDLKSAYRLRIQQVYLCSGRDGYVPVYDPTGTEYDEGPQFGCIQPNNRLGRRLVVLDRNRQSESDDSRMAAPLVKAIFAEEDEQLRSIYDVPGADGFVIYASGLFNMDAGYQWFLQVVYIIEPSSQRARNKRHTQSKNDYDQIATVVASFNGTNMRVITLANGDHNAISTGRGPPNFSYLQSRSTTPLVVTVSAVAILSAAIIAVIAVTYYRRHWQRGTPPHSTDQRRGDDLDTGGREGCFLIGCSGGRVQVVAKFGDSRSSCVVLTRSPSPPHAHLLARSDVTEV